MRRTTTPKLAPVHPGKILKSELEARELSQAAFAAHINIRPAYLNNIIRGRQGISTAMAFKLSRALGIDVEVWCNLQTQFEINSIDPTEFEDISEIAA